MIPKVYDLNYCLGGKETLQMVRKHKLNSDICVQKWWISFNYSFPNKEAKGINYLWTIPLCNLEEVLKASMVIHLIWKK